jgi:hypothetical protein
MRIRERPTCSCGRPCSSKGIGDNGARRWHNRCGTCIKQDRRAKRGGASKYRRRVRQPAPSARFKYQHAKGDRCAKCGFVPVHPCQLSVDHIDGNHDNDALSNLQTLCHNCHALKTLVSKDWGVKADDPDSEQYELF